MTQGQDRSALKWLKEDLNDLISQANTLLQDFVENNHQGEQIEDCSGLLHKIHGTLKMVQLTGASLLTEEMEAVATSLAEKQAGAPKDRAEALMIALVQLPDYLERLEKGAPDMPFSVLSLINDLKASRDATLLSETAFFAPHLNETLIQSVQAEPNPAFKDMAKHLRAHFHNGFLGWYSNVEP